jgi:hypothetical protein
MFNLRNLFFSRDFSENILAAIAIARENAGVLKRLCGIIYVPAKIISTHRAFHSLFIV